MLEKSLSANSTWSHRMTWTNMEEQTSRGMLSDYAVLILCWPNWVCAYRKSTQQYFQNSSNFMLVYFTGKGPAQNRLSFKITVFKQTALKVKYQTSYNDLKLLISVLGSGLPLDFYLSISMSMIRIYVDINRQILSHSIWLLPPPQGRVVLRCPTLRKPCPVSFRVMVDYHTFNSLNSRWTVISYQL